MRCIPVTVPAGLFAGLLAGSLVVLFAMPGAARAERSSSDGDACACLPDPSCVEQVDGQTRHDEGFEASQALRTFTLFAYRPVAGDIIEGRGPWLEAVAAAFRERCRDDVRLVAWLRAMLSASASSTEFSRRMGVAMALASECADSPARAAHRP